MAAFSSLDIARPHGRHALVRLLAFIAGLALLLVGVAPQANAAVRSTAAATATGTTIAGRVTDAVTGDPIAGVTVTAGQPETSDPAPTHTATTDADGRYSMTDLEATWYAVIFSKPGSMYLAETSNGQHCLQCWPQLNVAVGGTLTVDAQLDKGAIASGTVTDEAGHPLSGMSVYYYGSTDTDSGNDATTTDATGAWSLTVIPNADLWISTDDVSGPYLSAQWLEPDGSQPRLTGGQVRTDMDFHLVAGGTVSGRIVDSSGAPVAGVCATLVAVTGWVFTHEGCSRADGTFTTGGAPSGDYYVQFYGFNGGLPQQYFNHALTLDAATTVTVTAPADTPIGDATIIMGGTLSGLITDSMSAQPIAGCVMLYPEGTQFPTASACAGPDGSYTVAGIAPGTYRVQFSGPYDSGYLSSDYPTTLTFADGTVLTGINGSLTMGAVLTGTVTNTATGQPIAGAGVALQIPGPPGPFGLPEPQWVDSTMTDAQGHYTIKGIASGTYRVYAYADGLPGQWYDHALSFDSATPVALEVATTRTIDFGFTPYATADVLVTDAAGNPLPGINVFFWAGNTNYGSFTDSTGHARTTLPAGQYTIQFTDWTPGGWPTQWYNGKDTAETADPVTLTPGQTTSLTAVLHKALASISGHVVSDPAGAALAGIVVTAYDSTGAQAGQATTDASGAYTISGLTPGSYQLHFGEAGGRWAPEWWNNQPTQGSATSLTLQPGANTGIDAALAAAVVPVSGIVTDATSGLPLAGATVSAWSPADQTPLATTTTGADGSYQLSLEWGQVQLQVTPADASYRQTWWLDSPDRQGATTIDIAGPRSDLNVALPRLPKVTGTVTDSVTSAPVGGVTVSATLVGGSAPAATATTGADGGYVILGLAAGSYVITFDDGSGPYITEYSGGVYTVATATPVALTASAPWQVVNDALDKPGTITGTVVGKLKDNKDPVCVQVWSSATQAVGTPVCVTQGTAYTISRLLPGTYRVSGTLKKGETTWYAAATSYATATPVVVGSGATVTGIDVEAKPKTK